MQAPPPARAVSWLVPAAIIAATLIALIALPLLVNDQLEAHRNAIQSRAEPARHDLNEVNYQLSVQVSSLQRAILTGRASFREVFLEASGKRREAMDRLHRDVGFMDTVTQRRFNELDRAIEQWERSVQNTIVAPETAASQMAPGQSDYVEVVETIKHLDEAISRYQRVHSEQIARVMRRQFQITVILIAMALIALGSVLWLVSRMQTLASSLQDESQERMQALDREREARATAEGLVRARDEILGIVSHDLRSPLSTITLSTQLIRDSTPEQRDEYIDMVLSSASRMERLIRDLLDIAKLENSKLSIESRPTDMSEVVREVHQSHLPIAREKSIELVLEVDDSLPELEADRDRITQALTNLIGNALKFTPENGQVILGAHVSDDHLRFEVRDTGPGIATSDLPHLFDPFWQSKKTAHLGAGLGLKITRAIAEAHGGTIHVENAAGGGARFTIELPIRPQAAAQQRSRRRSGDRGE